jgi:hypothetical protein
MIMVTCGDTGKNRKIAGGHRRGQDCEFKVIFSCWATHFATGLAETGRILRKNNEQRKPPTTFSHPPALFSPSPSDDVRSSLLSPVFFHKAQ